MPMCFIEAPLGAGIAAKKQLVGEIAAALKDSYRLNDTRVFIREYPAENASQDGVLKSEIRPVCFIEGPTISIDVKRKMVAVIDAAVTQAYQNLIDAREVMILINEYPLGNAAKGGRLQGDKPEIAEALRQQN